MFQAQAARLDYVLTGNDQALALVDSAKRGLTGALDHLHSLTADNTSQSERLHALEPLLAERLALLDESVSLHKSNPQAQGRQIEITDVGRHLTQRISDQLDEMTSEEDRLLTERRSHSARTFERVRTVLAAAFGTVLLILAMDFRRLNIELGLTAAEELLEIIMRRYERASTMITSNRPVEDWGKLLGDSAAVTAMLDRLLHHGHFLKCGPRSWRTKTGLPPQQAAG